jgi:glycosyltransferase involved in cell wall biosynthesis
MKIAHVRDTLYPYTKGGAQKRVWEISKRLVERGHEVHIFGMKYWDGEDIIIKEGVYLHGVCKPQKLFVGERRSIGGPIYFAYKVLNPLLKNDFDLIICDNEPYFHCFSGKICSLLKKTPLIITWLEVWNDYWYEYLGRKGLFGKTIESITVRLSKNVIAISESSKKDLESIGVKLEIKVIPCGIDFEEIQNITPHRDKFDVVFAGRLIKDKNIDMLIKAISIVTTKIPDFKCIIIGDGPEKAKLDKLTHDLNLQTNVLFTGFLDDYFEVLSYMKSSDIFVFPSSREGFGIVALEANACGLPVITVNHRRNATTDFIKNNINGYVCEPSAEDIAQKIILTLTDVVHMNKFCVESASHYDWNEIVDSIESFYGGVLVAKHKK